jgi:hypothetical protein
MVEADQPRTYTLKLSPTEATIEEHASDGADASVTGGARAWIEAFSPQHGRGGLEISGDRALASRMLDALAGASSAEPTAASANPGAAAAA